MSIDAWLEDVFAEDALERFWQLHTVQPSMLLVQKNPARAFAYLTRLLERPAVLMDRGLSPESIGVGLKLLFCSSIDSGYERLLMDPRFDTDVQVRAVLGLYDLYRDVLTKVCVDQTNHTRGRQRGTSADTFVYMYWDDTTLLPPRGPDLPSLAEDGKAGEALERLNDAAMTVIERTLTLPHIACQEGALHGLGHLEFVDELNPRCVAAVTAFIATITPDHPLWNYAHLAREGAVL